MMRLIYVFVILTTALTLTADLPGKVQYRGNALTESRDKGFLKPNVSHAHGAQIDGKWQSNVWEYWYIKSGDCPESFDLKPMVWDNRANDAVWKHIRWKGAFVRKLAAQRYLPPFANAYGVYGVSNGKVKGGGFSLRNPFDIAAEVFLEGFLRVNPNCAKIPVFIYKKDKGNTELISSTLDSGALALMGRMRKYLKLKTKFTLRPGKRVYIIGVEKDNFKRRKTLPFIIDNDRWGWVFRPTFYLLPQKKLDSTIPL